MHRIQSSRGTGAGDWSWVLHSLYFARSAGSLSGSTTDRNCAGQSRSAPTSPHTIKAATRAPVMGLILNRDEPFIWLALRSEAMDHGVRRLLDFIRLRTPLKDENGAEFPLSQYEIS